MPDKVTDQLVSITRTGEGCRVQLRGKVLPSYLNANQKHYVKRRFKRAFALEGAIACDLPDDVLAFDLTGLPETRVRKLVRKYLEGIAALLDPPMSEKQVQELLSINREELKRWSADGRLPVLQKNTARRGTVKLNSLSFSSAEMHRIAETPEIIRNFRSHDEEEG